MKKSKTIENSKNRNVKLKIEEIEEESNADKENNL